jgi:hypothetical protein
LVDGILRDVDLDEYAKKLAREVDVEVEASKRLEKRMNERLKKKKRALTENLQNRQMMKQKTSGSISYLRFVINVVK